MIFRGIKFQRLIGILCMERRTKVVLFISGDVSRCKPNKFLWSGYELTATTHHMIRTSIQTTTLVFHYINSARNRNVSCKFRRCTNLRIGNIPFIIPIIDCYLTPACCVIVSAYPAYLNQLISIINVFVGICTIKGISLCECSSATLNARNSWMYSHVLRVVIRSKFAF